MPVYLKVERRVKLDDPINAVRILKLKPNACVVQIISVDLKVISIIRTDANALLGKELGSFFGTRP